MNTDREKLLVAERATEWLKRLETAGHEERAEFWKWFTESPLHMREVLLAKACDTVLAHLLRDRHIDIDAFTSQATNVHEIGSRLLGANGDPDKSPAAALPCLANANDAPRAARRSAWKVAAVAAFMAVLTLMTVGIEAVPDRTVVTVVTRAGEWRSTRLADGTLVHAGPRTKVYVEITDRQRIVRLARGEALFHVAKDRMRPFRVETDLATARALGTVFAVSRMDPDSSHVTVQEGVVEVTRRTHSRTDQTASDETNGSVTLIAGEQVRVTGALPLAVRSVDIEKELAWAAGWFVFDQETVAQAVQEFNLRNEIQIRILKATTAQYAVRGSFKAGDPALFASWLETQGWGSVVNDERGTLLLVPYPGAANKELKERSDL